jgi:hypothetical protein
MHASGSGSCQLMTSVRRTIEAEQPNRTENDPKQCLSALLAMACTVPSHTVHHSATLHTKQSGPRLESPDPC